MPAVTQALLGRFYMPSGTIDVDGDTVTTTAGYYYLGGGGDDTFDDHLETQIQSSVTGEGSATCSVNIANGKCTLTFGSTTTVTWTDTDIRDLLGFTGTLSGASTYTSGVQGQYIWMPSRAIANHPVDRDIVWDSVSNSRLVRSKDGSPYGVRGNLYYQTELEWQLLASTEVIRDTATDYDNLQWFWENVAHAQETIRYYPDDSDSATYVVGMWGDSSDELGSFTDYAARRIRSYNGLWDVSVPLVYYDES